MRIYVVKGAYPYGELNLYVGTNSEEAEKVLLGQNGTYVEIWENGEYVNRLYKNEIEHLRHYPEYGWGENTPAYYG